VPHAEVADLGRIPAFRGVANVVVSGGEDPLRLLPEWAESERYTIDAKPETPQRREMMQGPMMQSLLEDRFQLKIHRETRQVRRSRSS
jgi:hypothetical protein